MTDSSKTSAPPALTASEIFERGRTRRTVEIAFMGRTLWAHGFSRQEAKDYRRECVEAAGSIEADAYSDERFVQKMVKDSPGPDARRIFQPEDLMRLADLNEADWVPLYMACLKANGWGQAAEDEIRKNSERTRPGGSGSASQPGTESPT